MTEGIVDTLEVVEVEKEEGDPSGRAAGAPARMLQPVEKERPVGEVRERVVKRLMRELPLQVGAL